MSRPRDACWRLRGDLSREAPARGERYSLGPPGAGRDAGGPRNTAPRTNVSAPTQRPAGLISYSSGIALARTSTFGTVLPSKPLTRRTVPSGSCSQASWVRRMVGTQLAWLYSLSAKSEAVVAPPSFIHTGRRPWSLATSHDQS